MTSGEQRPGDGARRALRAARERAESERTGRAEEAPGAPVAPLESAPEGPETTPPEAPAGATPERARTPAETEAERPVAGGPGDAARAALRAAMSARRGAGETATEPVPSHQGEDNARQSAAPATQAVSAPSAAPATQAVSAPSAVSAPPAASAPPAVSPPSGAIVPDEVDAPAKDTTVPQARPADAAREALRAARREARAAETDEATRRRTGAGAAQAAGSANSVPSRAVSPSAPDPASRAARLEAAQEMRHYLANAFRMPTWSDTPEEETPADATVATPDRPAPPALPPTASATAAGPAPAPDDLASAHTPSAPPEASASVHTPPGLLDVPASAYTPPGLPDVPASSHVPPTMATPHRDTELRRTFPAFGPRAATADDVPFAATWWGNAWVDALEQGALDAKRVARGRGYADQGHVDAITVTPGLVLAYVRGSRPRPYRVQVRVRTLEGEDWARFLDTAADRPGHIAALLDKELPQSLADSGVPLLPGPGDLAPRCSCPDSGHPCKHAAALCYQMARLLDTDPFVLLLLRGRGEKELLDALSRRSAARAARAAQERQPRSLPGVRAADALAPRRLPALPRPLPALAHPEQPPVYPAAPGGPDPFALDQLATDAAARAHALLTTGHDPVGELTLWQDAVRLAAARPGSGLTAATRTLYATLATAADRTPADLARAVAAWRQGGLAGLAVLEEAWDPPAGRFDRARPLLLAADLPAFRPWRNRLTHPRGHVQLRLGLDGLWYAYESEPDQDDWWPRGTPDLDPVGALTGTGLGTPDDS
ncbi:SWIM zinc finger family protein [Streptomyces yokosukanensis]|uniref:SWIM zinc finger family protein n=1 Tax=Streptomyces yokosukanensis TaxID=67386 RepID=UPI003F4D172E